MNYYLLAIPPQYYMNDATITLESFLNIAPICEHMDFTFGEDKQFIQDPNIEKIYCVMANKRCTRKANYQLDYYEKGLACIISSELFDLFRAYPMQDYLAKEICFWLEGKNPSTKRFFYLYFDEKELDVVDYQQSKLEEAKSYGSFIPRYLKLKEHIDKEIFLLPTEIRAIHTLKIVVSERVKDRIEQQGLTGMKFYPIEYAIEMLYKERKRDISLDIKMKKPRLP